MKYAYIERGNENRLLHFPFMDDAMLVSIEGITLPTELILDACLYPDSPAGAMYVSKLDFNNGICEISDTLSRVVLLSCHNTPLTGAVHVVTPENIAGGVIIFTEDTSILASFSGLMLTFEPSATVLTPSCVFFRQLTAVKSLEVGSRNVSGAVVLDGIDGIRTLSYISGGDSILRIDAVGKKQVAQGRSVQPITSVRVINEANAPVIGLAGGDTTLSIAGLFDASLLCNKSRLADSDGKLPSQYDICEEEHVKPQWAGEDGDEFTLDVSAGALYISSAAGIEIDNPIGVTVLPVLVPELDLGQMDTTALTTNEIHDHKTAAAENGMYKGRALIFLRGVK